MFAGSVLEYGQESLLKLYTEVGSDHKDNIQTIQDMMNILGAIDRLLLKLAQYSHGLTGNISKSVISNIINLQLSIERANDIRAKTSSDKNTALHIAAQNNDADAVLLLIRADADILQTNDSGHTPLDKAVASGSKAAACQKLLKRQGANNWTPLLCCVELGEQNTKQYLRIRSVLISIKQNQELPGTLAKWLERKVDRYIFRPFERIEMGMLRQISGPT